MRVGKACVPGAGQPPYLRRPAAARRSAFGVDQPIGLQLDHLLAHRFHRGVDVIDIEARKLVGSIGGLPAVAGALVALLIAAGRVGWRLRIA